MTTTRFLRPVLGLLATASLLIIGGVGSPTEAQSDGPVMLDPHLGVRPVAAGLNQPTTMAFLGSNDILVLEKATGQVQRVVGGAVPSTVLDLAVNFGSERGLLGIALHPDFPANPGVYLYWTESTTGADTNVLSADAAARQPRGSVRLERIRPHLRPQPDQAARHPAGRRSTAERGNHDGGVLAFGADGKLFVFVGDLGRRGQLQNLPCGPTADVPRPDRARRPVRWAGARQRPPQRRRTAAQRRRHRAVRQPVLRSRRGDGRRGRRERPEDLLLRPPQQLRDGRRSAVRRGVAAGERR